MFFNEFLNFSSKFGNIEEYYDQIIKPKSQDVLATRSSLLMSAKANFASVFIAIIIGLLFYININELYPQKVFVIILTAGSLICLYLIFLICQSFADFNKKIRNLLFQDIFKFFNLSFGKTKYQNGFLSQCVVAGSYRDVKIEISQDGTMIFKMQFNNMFKGTTIAHLKHKNKSVSSKNDSRGFEISDSTIAKGTLKKINLKESGLHKYFSVKSNNEIEAKQILNIEFANKLTEFLKKSQTRRVSTTFHRNYLAIEFYPASCLFNVKGAFEHKDPCANIFNNLCKDIRIACEIIESTLSDGSINPSNH